MSNVLKLGIFEVADYKMFVEIEKLLIPNGVEYYSVSND